MKRNNLIVCFAFVLGMSNMLHAQAIPTASRLGSFTAGAGWFLSNPDFGQKDIQGMTFYSDFDFAKYFGAEGEIHYSFIIPTDVSENHYVLGPRFIHPQKHIEEYAKVLFGAGYFRSQIGNNPLPQTSTYFTYVMGGGIDVHVLRHLDIRAIDLEVQKWPGFPPNGLTPWSGSVGAAYVFH